MDFENEDLVLIMSLFQMSYIYLKYYSKVNTRRWWVRPVYQERNEKGYFETTFKFIKENDPDLFFKSTRMNHIQYNLLLSLVKKRLTKSSIRKAISRECRMVLTLTYLSQGVTPNYLAWSFRMGASTVRKIIVETCMVFWDVLSPIYMPELNQSDWKKISKEFGERWNMPNCVGSIDGKHIEIKCPPNSGSKYINYKGYFSIVLLGVCDANYTFSAVDVGAYGSQSDAGIFRNCEIGKKILTNSINFPPLENLPNSQKKVPYYFVGDSAFPLRMNLMRPYPGIFLNKREEVFNYRQSRARRVIENTFGILAARWRILGKAIEFHPESADKIVLACTILHNFLKITDVVHNSKTYCPDLYCDSYNEHGERFNGGWRQESINLLPVRRLGSNNRADGAAEMRNTLTNYFLNEGKVSFQPQ
ncbi:putative nuclease HARBI1 [Eupeodes corollae]|uniref:putative nuclease HARBI1 n=1 Tax=Eupeodes corollae TaxID=290404 RepID=UPI002491F96C|nr:putative nuclease HARBI1 [Eupeodes corollae]